MDVAVVGAGFTGLWTAYYLLQQDPSLQVVLFEAEEVGFGASGRNGGWVSSLWPVGMSTVAREHGEPAARDLAAALRATVDEVGAVCSAEGIDAGFRKGGALFFARGPAQLARAREDVEESRAWGEDAQLLTREEASARLAVAGVDGASFHPDCARVHPGWLVQGLARTVRGLGATIHEGTRVTRVDPASGSTPAQLALGDGPSVSARHVVIATEAWTPQLPGRGRRVVPVYSLMVATEPLPEQVWAQIGLADREVFADHGHLITYGQRTVDDRIAFGGRGAPYHLGSRITPAHDVDRRVHATLRHTLRSWLPQLEGFAFTHAWGGPLGIARDWHPHVGYDLTTRIGSAGGYVGDGVAATNLAGRTLADLILGRSTPETRLPWVGHVSPDWEPEPLRWLGVNAGLRLAGLADREERLTRRPALLGRALAALTGH